MPTIDSKADIKHFSCHRDLVGEISNETPAMLERLKIREGNV